jgi:hypothetical protein
MNTVMTLRVSVAAQLSASRKEFSSVELVMFIFFISDVCECS